MAFCLHTRTCVRLSTEQGPTRRAGCSSLSALAHTSSQRALQGGELLGNDARLVLLAASEGFLLNTARELALVDAHSQYINPTSLEGLTSHRARLDRLEATHVAQKEQAIWFNEQVDALLQAYHDMVHILVVGCYLAEPHPSQVFTLSSQLLKCDALLEALEKKEEKKKKGESAVTE
jgi:hypothetical protein